MSVQGRAGALGLLVSAVAHLTPMMRDLAGALTMGCEGALE